MTTKPNLFIVGLPKAGTTSLFNYLNEHTQIFLSEIKEPHFFNTDTNNQQNLDNVNEYLKLFENAKNHKYIGEGSTHYAMSVQAPKNIKSFSPDSKIIMMLRKPSEIIYSAYYQNVYNGTEKELIFEDALKIENSRNSDFYNKLSVADSYHLQYSRFVRYEEYLTNYFDTFGRDNVHVIFFENFKRKTKEEYKKVLDFLSLDAEDNITFRQYNAAKEAKSNVVRDFLRKPPKLLISLSRLFFNKKTRRQFLGYVKKKNTLYVKKEEINPKTEKELTRKYAFEVEKLEKLLDVNLSHWK